MKRRKLLFLFNGVNFDVDELSDVAHSIGEWLKSDGPDALVLQLGSGSVKVRALRQDILEEVEEVDLKVKLRKDSQDVAEARHQIVLTKRT